MDNLIFGILTVAICIAGYVLSWRFKAKENYSTAVLLLVLCGLLLRVFTSCDFFLHEWDERYHALVAKNLMKHPLVPTLYENAVLHFDYREWTGSHIWLHKQPFPLWTIAGSLWLFGINEIAVRLPSIIFTTLGIWLTYFIGRYFFDKRVGYLAAFFYSINGLIIELTAGRIPTDHIDVFFLFFVELAIVFGILYVEKRKTIYTILAGISMGAAILSKWLPALIVIPVLFLIFLHSGKFRARTIVFQLFILFMTSVVIFLPWQIYIHNVFPAEAAWESEYNLKHITHALEKQGRPFYYFLSQIRINYGELIYLPLIWFGYRTIKHFPDHRRNAILIWFLIPFIFFSFVTTKMQGYLLFTSPALFIMIAEFCFSLYEYARSSRMKWVFYLILILLFAFPIRYTIERVKPFEKKDRNPQWVQDLRTLDKKKIQKGILLNYPRPIEAMFYTDLTVYWNIPEQEIIEDLIDKGFTVLINESGSIPEDIKTIPGIRIVDLASNK